MKEPVLAIAAHPDDEVLGCGATLTRLAREGHPTYIAILGEGITSRYPTRQEADPAELRKLRECSQRAADSMGVRELFSFDLPDNRFDTVALLDVIKIIEGVIKKVQPKRIFTHHISDLNIDHTIVARAVLTATRPMAGRLIPEIYAFEVASSTEWAFQQTNPVFKANYFVGVKDTLDVKLRCMREYDGEHRAFPHPRSPEALTAIARRWGSVVGLEAAEAFEQVRAVVP